MHSFHEVINIYLIFSFVIIDYVVYFKLIFEDFVYPTQIRKKCYIIIIL